MRRASLLLLLANLVFLLHCGGGSSASGGGGNTGGNGSGGPVSLQSITLTPGVASIPQGTMQSFTATGNYSDGTTKDLTATAQWSCLLPNIATVGNTSPNQGLVKGVSPGTALITASSGSVSNNAVLTVSDATVTTLVVTPATPTIGYGDQQQFTATATFSDNSQQDVTNLASWTASPSPFIASNTGLAIGQSLGVNTVTATFQAGSGTATLTVDLSNLVSVAVLPANPSVANFTQAPFTAVGTFNDGSTRDVTSLATWSSSDPTIAKFAGTGSVARGEAVGTTTITATVGTFTPSTNLNVTGATLQSIASVPVNASIAPGAKINLKAIGTFSDSTTEDLTGQVTWSTSDPSIATVLPSKGVVTGVAAGAAQATATSSVSLGSIQSSTPVNVTSASLTSIAVAPAAPFIPPGGNLAFSATGTYSDTSSHDITASSTWSSSVKTVATVKTNVATGQGFGQSTITAKVGTISGTTALSVVAPQQISLAITPGTPQIAGQTTTQLTATGTFLDGSTQDLTSSVSWSSSSAAVATVGNHTGLVSGLTPGQTTITAAIGPTTSTAQVTITNATLSSITLSPATPSIAVGSSQQFTATGQFSDGSSQTLPGVTWSSSDTTLAVVDSSGLATGLAAGAPTITATYGGVSGTTVLTLQ